MVVEPISVITLLAAVGACFGIIIDKCFGGCRKSKCSEIDLCCCHFVRNVPQENTDEKI